MSPHSTSVFTAKEPVTGGRRRLTFSYSALTAAEMLAWRWISSSGCEWSAGWTERDDWTRCSGLRAAPRSWLSQTAGIAVGPSAHISAPAKSSIGSLASGDEGMAN